MNQIPFQSVLHHSYFGVTMGRARVDIGKHYWAECLLKPKQLVILTIHSLNEVKGGKMKYAGVSGQSLS